MCVKNPVAIVDMLVTLICVLKDSADVSPVLLDHFKDFGGYRFLSNLLVDFYDSDDVAVNDTSRNLVILISSLALSGHKPIQIPSSIDAPFQQAGFSIPKPISGSGNFMSLYTSYNFYVSLCLAILQMKFKAAFCLTCIIYK